MQQSSPAWRPPLRGRRSSSSTPMVATIGPEGGGAAKTSAAGRFHGARIPSHCRDRSEPNFGRFAPHTLILHPCISWWMVWLA